MKTVVGGKKRIDTKSIPLNFTRTTRLKIILSLIKRLVCVCVGRVFFFFACFKQVFLCRMKLVFSQEIEFHIILLLLHRYMHTLCTHTLSSNNF